MSEENITKERTIMRTYKNTENPYVMLNKQFINDASLSWKAKGILTYMLSKPDDWVFYTDEIIKNATDGIKSLNSGIKELKEAGYMKRFPVYENGKIHHWEYRVYETVELAQKHCVATDAPTFPKGKSSKCTSTKVATTNNDLILNNESTNILCEKNKISKKEIEKFFEEMWNRYPLKKGKQTALKTFEKLLANKGRPDAEKLAKAIWCGFLAHLEESSTKQQLKDQGADIWVPQSPHLATWLNNRRWEDDYQSISDILSTTKMKKGPLDINQVFGR